MKNVTVSVQDEVYHRARVKAAEQRTTVSAMVRQFLEQVTGEENDFERLRRQQNELIAQIRAENAGFSAAERLSRAEVHERSADTERSSRNER